MIDSYDLITVAGEYITADLLVWRRYRRRSPGILEALLDANPRLAVVHRETPFIPVGMEVRIPIDSDLLKGRPQPTEFIQLYGRNTGSS